MSRGAAQSQLNGKNLPQRLSSAYAQMSPKTKRVARFVEAHLTDAGFMNTRDLAQAAGVSLATVVRFPRVLGYEDFEEFRLAIRDHVNIELGGVERLKSLPHDEPSIDNLMNQIIKEDVENLRRLTRNLSEQHIERFVESLQTADRTVVLAFRYVAPLGSYFAYSLDKIKPGVEVHTLADSTLYDRVRSMGPHDAIVAIGFARYPSDLVKLLHYARSLERRVLCITDSSISPLVSLADTCVFAAGTIRDFVGSLAAPGALINCLISELARRTEPAAVERLGAVEEAATAGHIYARSEDDAQPPRQWRSPIVTGAADARCGQSRRHRGDQ